MSVPSLRCALLLAALLGSGCLRQGLAVQSVTWERRTPTVAWEPCDVETYLRGDSPELRESIQRVTYDLRVYRGRDARLVYARDRLEAPDHAIGGRLDADTAYRVTVRPRYHLPGGERVGEWACTRAPSRFPTPMELLFEFRTPR